MYVCLCNPVTNGSLGWLGSLYLWMRTPVTRVTTPSTSVVFHNILKTLATYIHICTLYINTHVGSCGFVEPCVSFILYIYISNSISYLCKHLHTYRYIYICVCEIAVIIFTAVDFRISTLNSGPPPFKGREADEWSHCHSSLPGQRGSRNSQGIPSTVVLKPC